jgi:hypothetical protein
MDTDFYNWIWIFILKDWFISVLLLQNCRDEIAGVNLFDGCSFSFGEWTNNGHE